ncbi:unnamed protein product, partial [Didymodactylos carnosus]
TTIERVKNSSREQWCYHRYLLIEEYTDKHILPLPFKILLWPFEHYGRKLYHHTHPQKAVSNITKDNWQRECRVAEEYWQQKVTKIMQKLDNDYQSTSKIFNKL